VRPSAAELSELLAGDDPLGEGYLAKAARLTAARHQAEEMISHEYRPPAEMKTTATRTTRRRQPGNDRWSWTAATHHGRT
jgi:hypothetical protein